MRFLAVTFLTLVVGACSLNPAYANRASIPDNAWQYQRLMIRSALAEFGHDKYVALLAAQTHQESTWRADLKSRVGAMGPSQFMPSTARWFIKDMGKGLPCRVLSDFLDFACAIPAQVRFMAMLWRGVRNTANECERVAMTLSKYNGGGIKADRQMAARNGYDAARWFNNTELFNGRNRAEHNFKENRGYLRRILLSLQQRFLKAGYRGRELCTEHLS